MLHVNQENKKKSKFPVGLIVLICMVISGLAEGDSDAVIGIVAIGIVVAAIRFLIKLAKKPGKDGRVTRSAVDSQGYHSHDRLEVSSARVRRCEGIDHWKEQLDGFMKAGLIDRAEYNVLLERYVKELEQNKQRR